MLAGVAAGGEPSIGHPLAQDRGPICEAVDPVDDVHDQVEAVQVVEHHHVKRCRRGTSLLESPDMEVMVIGADANSTIVNYKDRTTCTLFGDGAGAVLIEPAEEGEVGLIDFVHEIDGSGGVSLNLPAGGSLNPATHETIDKKMHFIHQDGQAVYKFAVRKMAEATTKLLERNGVTGADLGCFIPHQANKRIITSTADRLGMPADRVIINIEKYGNTSAGTIPLALETAVEEGKLKKGDLVLIAAVGAGFTVGTALLRWEI